jgi:inward rectifier potassium channel
MADSQIRSGVTPPRRPPRARVRSIGNRRIVAEGLEPNFWNDFYHNAMTVTWPVFFGSLAAAFVALNLGFAFVYWLGEAPIANAPPGSFPDLFFFSVETSSTVGYGDMHPQTLYGHLVATCENFVGMVLLAVMTGLVFSRFSRPRARIIFARNPVITQHDGVPTLIFRIANARSSFISEATAKLWMLGPSETKEGRRFIAFQPMRLVKSENPSFVLSWTLFHPIDETSPIQGLSGDDLAASDITFVVSVSGLDETSAQMVHSRENFAAGDVRVGHEFVDIMRLDESGVRHVDYGRVHDTRPVTDSRVLSVLDSAANA